MKITLEPGSYVVAVSGGVDSMALLHLLVKLAGNVPGYTFVVAHFDHGMRVDSAVDRELVQATALKYGVPFVYDRVELGEGASEDAARRARYGFLHQVRQSSGAKAIITAQHEDDMVETAMLNLLRGTGRRGITSMKSTDLIKRPLLHMTKQDLVGYAQKNKLTWREDSTNTDPRYLRNHLRHNVIPRLSDIAMEEFLEIIEDLRTLNEMIDYELGVLRVKLTAKNSKHAINRSKFIMLPHSVALEIMLDWLRSNEVSDISRPMLEKLVTAAKTLKAEKEVHVDKTTTLKIGKKHLYLLKKP